MITFACSPASGAQLPSYSRPDAVSGEETIRGRITNFFGQNVVEIRDERGFFDEVYVEPTTPITPAGTILAPDMQVAVLGYNRGNLFAASEIDMIYPTAGMLPSFPYFYPYYSYSYPYFIIQRTVKPRR
jgi:hypothetical protein